MKCGRVSFMPVLARFGRFGGLSRESGPTDHLCAKRALNRKFGKIKVLSGVRRVFSLVARFGLLVFVFRVPGQKLKKL